MQQSSLRKPSSISPHPLPLMPSGTRTARCAQWCWRTRAARTATPAEHTSTAGMPSRPTAERRADEREHMHHQEAGTLFLSLCTCRFCSALCDTRMQTGQQGVKSQRQLPAGVTDTACGRRQLMAAGGSCLLHPSPGLHNSPAAPSTAHFTSLAPPKAPTGPQPRLHLPAAALCPTQSSHHGHDLGGPQPRLHLPAAAGRPADRLVWPCRPGWPPHGTQ